MTVTCSFIRNATLNKTLQRPSAQDLSQTALSSDATPKLLIQADQCTQPKAAEVANDLSRPERALAETPIPDSSAMAAGRMHDAHNTESMQQLRGTFPHEHHALSQKASNLEVDSNTNHSLTGTAELQQVCFMLMPVVLYHPHSRTDYCVWRPASYQNDQTVCHA